jgi:uncharacterized membrane protein
MGSIAEEKLEGAGTMADNDGTVEVFISAYSDPDRAKASLQRLESMHKNQVIDMIDAATIFKDEHGKLHVKETANHTRRDLGEGIAIGAVFGIIFPPSIIASAIVGGAAGGLFGHFTKKGLSKDSLTEADKELAPGQTGLMVVAIEKYAEQIKAGLQDYSTVSEHVLDADASKAVIGAAAATPDK